MRLFDRNYKYYMIVPAILLILFIYLVFFSPKIAQGIDLKGGTLIVFKADKPVDAKKLEGILSEQFNFSELKVSSVSGPGGYGVNIEFAENKDLSNAAKELNLAKGFLESNDAANAELHARNSITSSLIFLKDESMPSLKGKDLVDKADELYSKARNSFTEEIRQVIRQNFGLSSESFFQVRSIEPTLGKAFRDNAVFVAIVAFISIIIVVFVAFREFIPSLAIIFAGMFDVLSAMSGMVFFGIPLSLNSIPALLMLFGYSVDTDILLTTRLLKRRERTPRERTIDAMWTGITMTLTALVAVIVMLVFSYLYQIIVIFEIAAVLLFGLIGDMIATWMFNAPVLLWYFESIKSRVRK
ncbi:MAG: hypothetical protein AB1467_04280 [Candidatus Diapherotrites archaeon]